MPARQDDTSRVFQVANIEYLSSGLSTTKTVRSRVPGTGNKQLGQLLNSIDMVAMGKVISTNLGTYAQTLIVTGITASRRDPHVL
jgi:hypothetical protein